MSETYFDRKKRGVCVSCGKQKEHKELVRCDRCAEINRTHRRKYDARHRNDKSKEQKINKFFGREVVKEHNDLIAHTVKIDDFTEITLKIPKTLSAMELKGLMLKANKIFNISDVQIPTVQNHYTTKWNKEKVEKLKELKNSGLSSEEIAEKLGVKNSKCINSKIYSLKQTGVW